ncbi:MAG: pilus assembly protein [Planctomycetaceae bacterium]|nr:pilus assembly protein [Planctomycetaceae bacterium]
MRTSRQIRQTTQPLRSGLATLEAAVTLPLLLLLVFASIDMANVVYLKQSLNISAYEGATTASKPGGTATLARTRAQEVLTARNITGATIQITPTVVPTTSAGGMIIVTVRAPVNRVLVSPFHFFADDAQISSEVRMVRL